MDNQVKQIKTWKVEIVIKCAGNPRKWIPDAIMQNLDDDEDILDYTITEDEEYK